MMPGVAHSARLDEVCAPPVSDGAVLVRTIALGVCGTDHEILSGLYGSAPQGEERLILGHESLGVVQEAPADCGFTPGDHVVGIVRRPDPVPCPACAAGEWDMCRNGLYTERGIKQRHGFGSEFFRIEPEFAVKAEVSLGLLAVLTEPASVVAKAWSHIERIGQRARVYRPRNVLVTGAGPVGLLAAMMGAQRGLDVHMLDRHRDGPKPALAGKLGRYYPDVSALEDLRFDIVLECTAAPALVAQAITRCAPAGIVCLVGVSAAGQKQEFDIGGFNRTLVLDNDVVFGTVNANLAHYKSATEALAKADRRWLEALISRRVPLAKWQEALKPRPDDIKVVIEFG